MNTKLNKLKDNKRIIEQKKGILATLKTHQNNQRPAFCDANALIERSFCLLNDYWSEDKLQLSVSTITKILKFMFNLS